jgi:hypothetical protein
MDLSTFFVSSKWIETGQNHEKLRNFGKNQPILPFFGHFCHFFGKLSKIFGQKIYQFQKIRKNEKNEGVSIVADFANYRIHPKITENIKKKFDQFQKFP